MSTTQRRSKSVFCHLAKALQSLIMMHYFRGAAQRIDGEQRRNCSCLNRQALSLTAAEWQPRGLTPSTHTQAP